MDMPDGIRFAEIDFQIGWDPEYGVMLKVADGQFIGLQPQDAFDLAERLIVAAVQTAKSRKAAEAAQKAAKN